MGGAAIDTLPSRRRAFSEAYTGKKVVMAVTGVMRVFFLIGHLIGNLLSTAKSDTCSARRSKKER